MITDMHRVQSVTARKSIDQIQIHILHDEGGTPDRRLLWLKRVLPQIVIKV